MEKQAFHVTNFIGCLPGFCEERTEMINREAPDQGQRSATRGPNCSVLLNFYIMLMNAFSGGLGECFLRSQKLWQEKIKALKCKR